MKMQIMLIIEEGREQNISAKAIGREDATITIYAGSKEEAQDLIVRAQDLAAEACRNWKPEDVHQEEEPAQDQKHYIYYTHSIEDMDERAAEYEGTPAGKRFKKRLDNAIAFYFKHSKGGLLCTQLEYLANKHYNSLLNGSIDLSALAYRTGYNAGKAAAKK